MHHKDGQLIIEGRELASKVANRHPLTHEGPLIEYRKTKTVLAREASEAGMIYTTEGAMSFERGDFIVTDIPPTHAWPVRREVFLNTHEAVGARELVE